MSQTRISEVNISIWNKQQVQFQANPDVNIIMGINGSGKTTFLSNLYKSFHRQHLYEGQAQDSHRPFAGLGVFYI